MTRPRSCVPSFFDQNCTRPDALAVWMTNDNIPQLESANLSFKDLYTRRTEDNKTLLTIARELGTNRLQNLCYSLSKAHYETFSYPGQQEIDRQVLILSHAMLCKQEKSIIDPLIDLIFNQCEATLEKKISQQRSLIHAAKKADHLYAFQKLIAILPNANQLVFTDAEKIEKTLLIMAVCTGEIAYVQAVLSLPDMDEVNINACDGQNNSALAIAASLERSDIVAALLARGATDFYTAACFAAQKGDLDTMKLLYNVVRRYQACNLFYGYAGYSPLMLAVIYRQEKIIVFLAEKANIDQLNTRKVFNPNFITGFQAPNIPVADHDWTALDIAIHFRHARCEQYLRRLGANTSHELNARNILRIMR